MDTVIQLVSLIVLAALGLLAPVLLLLGLLARTFDGVGRWRKRARLCVGVAAAASLAFVSSGLWGNHRAFETADSRFLVPKQRARVAAVRREDALSCVAAGLVLTAPGLLTVAVLAMRQRQLQPR